MAPNILMAHQNAEEIPPRPGPLFMIMLRRCFAFLKNFLQLIVVKFIRLSVKWSAVFYEKAAVSFFVQEVFCILLLLLLK